MKSWSVSLGRFFGAEVRAHASFLFLFLFILLPSIDPKTGHGAGNSTALFGIILISALLHELAQLAAARRIGFPVRLLMLLPIGGVHFQETLERKQPSLSDETRIALAGPAASFILAALAYVAVSALHPETHFGAKPLIDSRDPYRSIFWVNLFLGALNLVPAYPLAGGRILRAVFSREDDDRAMATRRAVMMGQAFSTMLIVAGIWNLWMMLVGFFLFVAVQLEDRSLVFHTVMDNVSLEDIMLTDFSTLSPAYSLEDALSKAVHSLQDDFPVIRGADLVGVVSKQKIVEALKRDGNGYVQSVMSKAFEVAHRREKLGAAFRSITRRGTTLIPVVDSDRLVGIVTLQNLMHSMGLLAESRRLRDDS